MYKTILVPVENSPADATILAHIRPLARLTGAKLLLFHVADGWAARNYTRLQLVESEEMVQDRQYLEEKAAELRKSGLVVSTLLALGEPSTEILKTAKHEHCDLIAMTSHGHRFLADLFLGSTIHEVRHKSTIPVLLVRASHK